MSAAVKDTARRLRQSMAWIHTWLGLLAGWILFAMFLTGTASYFRPEITRWMQPEVRFPPVSASQAAGAAVAHIQPAYLGDEQWYIYLPDDRTGATRVFTRPRPDPDPKAPPAARRPELTLDPAKGTPVSARETRGGEHFYRFHFQLQLPHPWGRWLAGLCAMFMLSAIISGVITHKRIFADFFTLRWSKGQRSWLDAHNVSAVLALPFHAMITYTGLITLVLMYMPWPIMANFKVPETFAAQAYGRGPEDQPVGRSAALAPIEPIVDAAMREWQGARPATVIIRHPGDGAATVTIARGADQLNARAAQITYSGTTGSKLAASPPHGAAVTTAGVMLGLHMARFAGPALRWCAFLLGLTGAAMIGTGLMLWTAKRRRTGQPQFFGGQLVERLNIGAVACLPAGMAAFFLANRLIPSGLPGRADIEVSAMFWVWFGLAGFSLLRPVQKAWVETLAVSAMTFATVPVANALLTNRGFLASLRSGDWLFVSFDLAMLVIAAALAFAAKHAHAKRGELPRRRSGALSTLASGEAADAI